MNGTAQDWKPVMNNCCLCQSQNFEKLYDAPGFRTNKSFTIRQCTGCGLISAAVTPEDIAGAYEADYYETAYPGYLSDKAFHDRNNDFIVKDMEKYFKPGKIAEVGSAFGFFLQRAKARGWGVTGFECSQYASKAAREEYGVDVRAENFLSTDLPREYTMFAMLDTIEHLIDPMAMLKKGASILQPGGGAYVCTGDIDSLFAKLCGKKWRMMVPPLHTYYFTPDTLGKMMEKAGFKILSIKHHGKDYNVGSIVQYLTGMSKEKLPKIPLPLNLGDVMTAVGRYEG